MSNEGKAVFLSYASQDAEAARRICETLRAAGVEVWFDADGGLEHGDEWDTKIRRQIKECVLFIPIISANTQARLEGYFRIEWELAAQRAMGIASGVPFILPVVIDDTREPEALVPDRFRVVQWTKLPGGVVTPEVKARYLKLWSHRVGAVVAGVGDPGPASARPATSLAAGGTPALPGGTRRWLLPLIAATAVLGGIAWWLSSRPSVAPNSKPHASAARLAKAETQNSKPPTESAAEAKSVAVLAFKTLGDDRESEYFSEGISGELLNVLAKVPGLRVAAPASSFYFKDKSATTQEMGRKLNVTYLVDGSVQRMGATARVVARLSRAETGEQVWSDRFQGELKNIFALQDEIAGAIARNLSLKLEQSTTSAQAVNPEAHRLLLEGRHFWTLRTAEGFASAETAFASAANLAPDWAPLLSAQADLWLMEALYSSLNGTEQPEKLARAEAAARRAIALRPEESQPHATLGEVAVERQQWTAGEEHFRRALELSPNNATAHNWFGDLLEETGRLGQAIEQYQRAEQIDPLSYFILADVNLSLVNARRYREALPYLARTEALAPGRVRTGVAWGQALAALGRRDEAKAKLFAVFPALIAGQENYMATAAIHTLRQLGEEERARELADAVLRAMPPEHPFGGFVLLAMGRKDDGFARLEQSIINFTQGWILYWAPELDAVRDDPRFRRVLEKTKYAEHYAAARADLARMTVTAERAK